MSTVKKKGDKSKKPKKSASKANDLASQSRYDEQADAESVVQKSVVGDEPKNEALPEVEAPIKDEQNIDVGEGLGGGQADEADQREEEGSGENLEVKELVSKQTVGANLGEVNDDQKSFAATEKQNVLDDDFVDMKNQGDVVDKYSEGGVVKDEQSVEEALGFIDEEQIEPKQSAALLQQHLQHIQSSWKHVQNIGLERFGTVFFKNIIKFCPQALNMLPFNGIPNMYQSQIFKAHSKKVMEGIEKTTKNVSNLDNLKTSLFPRLMEDNNSLGVNKEMSDKVQKSFIMTMEMGLKQNFTPQAKLGWEAFYKQAEPLLTNFVFTGNISQQEEDEDEDISIGKVETLQKPDETMLQNSIMDNSQQEMLGGRIDDDMLSVKSKTNQVVNEFNSQVSMSKGQKEEIKDHYLKVFRKEVDFHHKIAYRFEKAYRLGRKMTERQQTLNLEIIDCISEHSGYIEQDPMALFYCLFFCIQYHNESLIEFLRTLIQKIHSHKKIDKLLEYIDVNGIQRIRTEGEQIKQLVYHTVFYQAIDDDLRIVYYQIMRNIKFLQLRDVDAIHLLNTRDYELIRLSFERNTTKLNLTLFQDFGPDEKIPVLKCAGYRKYTPAYYEVIIIYNTIESRVSLNYRERFLVSPDDIYNVFQMYCKEDFDVEFSQTKKDDISHQQYIELFITCFRNDSFKIATLIYTCYLKPAEDMDQKMMDILMNTIKDSVKFHEMKLFFLHEHFDVLSIAQMNYLIDIYQDILNIKDPKLNPIINQFNTIKIALLIFRICWKIEQKQIYSLITKCSLLQSLLIKSLSNYFEKQNNILVLYKFMSEPILHMSERKDSLDIMYEMNMQELLKHPVVIEVLNLVYEGKYSVSQSALSMSQTFQAVLDMDTMSLKSINERLVQNIVNFGDTGSAKQTSMQYNIWKQSIQQRESDEMVFTVLISMILIGIAIALNQVMNTSYIFMKENFEEPFFGRIAIFTNANEDVLRNFCPRYIEDLKEEYGLISMFYLFIIVNTIGMFTQVFQKLTIFRVKDNVTLNLVQLTLETSIAVVGILFIMTWNQTPTNILISETCGKVTSVTGEDARQVNLIYQLKNPREGEMNMNLLISGVVAQSCIISIIMLQRTQNLGQLIMMLQQMMNEFSRFFATFGLIIGAFILIGRMLGSEFKKEHASFFVVFLDLFNAFNGNMHFDDFKMPIGQAYIAIFMFIFKIMFLSLLAAMFINRYKQVFKNLDAYRRFNIIKLKNSVAYDKFMGGATLTFFPINILVLPFIIPLIFLRSARLSDTMLKLQYVIMMLMYCIIAMTFVVPATPFLYFKVVVNSIYIAFYNKRQDYTGQNVVMMIASFVLGPIAITVSIIIDLLSLPNTLLKESKGFEHKYQLSSDRLNDVQIEVVMQTFGKIFYGQNFVNYKGQHMTLIQLMMMHRRIFSIVDNLHDLTCRGNKDYKQALSNVQDYNMTKILTRKCAIPDKNGDYKEGKCELDVIYAVQMDIEMYNYVDIVLRKLKLGILNDELKSKAKGSSVDPQEAGGNDDAAEDAPEEAAKGAEGLNDEEDEETKKVEGVFPIIIGPDGVPLKRNNSDVFNNFHIQYAVLSFTDLEQQLIAIRNNGEAKRNQKFEKEVEQRKETWKKQIVGTFQAQAELYDDFLKGELGMQKQTTVRSTHGNQKGSNESKKNAQTESTDSNERNSKSQKNPQSVATKK